jgi:hypothetical protein
VVAIDIYDGDKEKSVIYVQNYLYGSDLSEMPHFHCKKGDTMWFEKYKNQIEKFRRNAKDVDIDEIFKNDQIIT